MKISSAVFGWIHKDRCTEDGRTRFLLCAVFSCTQCKKRLVTTRYFITCVLSLCVRCRIRNGVAGVPTSQGSGWSGVRIPAGEFIYCSQKRSKSGSGTHPASCAMGTRVVFPGAESPRLSMSGVTHVALICFHGVDRVNFLFLFLFF